MVALRINEMAQRKDSHNSQILWNRSFRRESWQDLQLVQYAANTRGSHWLVYQHILDNSNLAANFAKLITIESDLQWIEQTTAKREYLINVARAYVQPEVLAMGEKLESSQAGELRLLEDPIDALQENLYRIAKIASKFVQSGKHINMPILANLRIFSGKNQITMIGTNLETMCIVKCGAKRFTESGLLDTTIPAQLFTDLLEMLPPERVSISQTGNGKNKTFSMKCGNASANLKTIDSSEFPGLALTKEYGDLFGSVDTKTLKSALAEVCAGSKKADRFSNDESMVKLTFTNQYTATRLQLDSANGLSLTTRIIQLDSSREYTAQTVMLGADSLKLVASALDSELSTEIYDTHSCVWFCQGGEVSILIRKLARKASDYSKVESIDYADNASVNYGEFLRAVKLSTPASSMQNESPILITVKAAKLTIAAESLERGNSSYEMTAQHNHYFGVQLDRELLIKTLAKLGGNAKKPGKPKTDKKTGEVIQTAGDTRMITIDYSWHNNTIKFTIDGKQTVLAGMNNTPISQLQNRNNDYWMHCDTNTYSAE